MATGMLHTHLLSVILFLLLYIIKTFLLVSNKEEALAKFSKATRIAEMIISTLFLVTGIYLLTIVPEIKSLLIIKIVIVFASIPVAVIGFKKKNKALAIISLLMIITAYGLAEMSKKQASKSMENINAATIDGKELYEQSCIACHGSDGKLMLAGAKDLSISTISFDEKKTIIKNGKNLMTGFGEALNDAQIEAVATYLESLKK